MARAKRRSENPHAGTGDVVGCVAKRENRGVAPRRSAMGRIGKNLARAMLGLVTAAGGFVIAACYGAMYAYNSGGRVVDARSQQGVSGARVDCRQGGRSIASAVTDSGGSYDFGSLSCDEVLVEDSNGRYQPQTVPSAAHGSTYVELQAGK